MKNLIKILLFVYGGAFIGLIAGQFIGMPFLLFSRADTATGFQGSELLRNIANIIYPFVSSIGFFIGVYIAKRKGNQIIVWQIVLLLVLPLLLFLPQNENNYFDYAAYNDAVISFVGFLLGACIGIVSLFLITRGRR